MTTEQWRAKCVLYTSHNASCQYYFVLCVAVSREYIFVFIWLNYHRHTRAVLGCTFMQFSTHTLTPRIVLPFAAGVMYAMAVLCAMHLHHVHVRKRCLCISIRIC